MTNAWSPPTRKALPIILIRGFGGLGVDEIKKVAYQGFNDGTVYPHKRGDNYIYEGLTLRFMKSGWQYYDATNVVGYYSSPVVDTVPVPTELDDLKDKWAFYADPADQKNTNYRVVLDPGMTQYLLNPARDPMRTLWIFRYYDLNDRKLESYGTALVRLIDLIRDVTAKRTGSRPKVNIIAHSMGGLLARAAIQMAYPKSGRKADDYINKIVTLGTPHQGISFQLIKDWMGFDMEDEIEHFNPDFQKDARNTESYLNLQNHFPLERLLTVVGTNYRTYASSGSSLLNRIFSVGGEFGPNYNRSDGLVKQTFAQVPGAPRTFVHKSHGGNDSLVTSREAFEIASRFFFGNVRARLRLVRAKITRGKDLFGKSEFFLGVSIKPRKVDFDLFHQSADAENCYGPFNSTDLTDNSPAFAWAGANRLIWEGYLDTSAVTDNSMVVRLDFYVGERDLFGIGFSDNVIFRDQVYLRAIFSPALALYRHNDEQFATAGFVPAAKDQMRRVTDGWEFDVSGSGFRATFKIELDQIPEEGQPVQFQP